MKRLVAVGRLVPGGDGLILLDPDWVWPACERCGSTTGRLGPDDVCDSCDDDRSQAILEDRDALLRSLGLDYRSPDVRVTHLPDGRIVEEYRPLRLADVLPFRPDRQDER